MTFPKLLTAAAASLVLVACSGGESDPLAGVSDTAAASTLSQVLEGRYLVMLTPGEAPVLERLNGLLNGLGGTALMSLPIINGALVSLTEAQAALLATLPGVLHVEQDQILSTRTVTQSNATWGLDRSDQRSLPLDRLYTYPAQAGAGVNVYIVDTGINLSHVDFGGRVLGGRNFASSSPLDSFPIPLPLPIDLGGLLGGLLGGGVDPENFDDCNGHGTHVAGTAAGNTWGIAKGANLYAVRVLGCSGSGSTSGVIAGVQWVADNHVKPAVANMSLGGGSSEALRHHGGRGR
jgi:subtilisin family serine protease